MIFLSCQGNEYEIHSVGDEIAEKLRQQRDTHADTDEEQDRFKIILALYRFELSGFKRIFKPRHISQVQGIDEIVMHESFEFMIKPLRSTVNA